MQFYFENFLKIGKGMVHWEKQFALLIVLKNVKVTIWYNIINVKYVILII